MSDKENKEINLDEQYKKIVESEESPAEAPKDLGKVDMSKFQPEEAREADVILGYHNLDVSNLPSNGMFYPEDIRISIRSAKVQEIRHFSTINEQDVLDIDEKLNSIVETCTKVTCPSKKMSYKDLLEEDRFYLILSIRDLTFPEPESKLTVDYTQKKTGEKHNIEIKKEYFQYFQVPDEIAKYYDKEGKCFSISTKSFGIIEMRPPTIGVMQKITAYIREKQREEANIDQSVLQVAPYLIKEWRGFTDKNIFDFEIEMNGWTNQKYSLIYNLAEKMKVGVQPNMLVTLGDEEEQVPINFRNGLKSLFIVQDFSSELL